MDSHQRALAAATQAVLAKLDVHAGAAPRVAPAEDLSDEISALDALCSCFGLTGFERSVLVLAAAVELDPSAAARCAAASGDPHRSYPTFSLALAAFDGPHWSALTPVAPLRRWRLVEPDPDPTLTTARLRIDERVLHFLVGVPYVDSRLRGMLTRVDAPEDLPASQRRSAESVATAWTELDSPHVQLVGADQPTRWEVAAAAARHAGVSLHAMFAEDLPTGPVEREALARLWEREALLLPAALLVEATEQQISAVQSFVNGLAVPVVVSALDPLAASRRQWPRIVLSRPTQDEQRVLWASALNGRGPDVTDRQLRDLVAQFSLPAHVIRSAGKSVSKGTGDSARLAWQAGLAQARMALDELGHRIEPRAVPADLVLPGAQRAILGEIVAHVRQRAKVYQEWGFEAVLRAAVSASPRCSPAAAAPARRSPPRCWPASSASTCSSSTCRRWSASTSARPRRTCAASSTPPRAAARCCSSTRPTRCSASAARSRTATTGTPTSRSATC